MYRYSNRTLYRELILLLVAAFFLIPVYFLIVLSLKSTRDVYTAPDSFPTNPVFGNYASAWKGAGTLSLSRALLNTVIITSGSVLGLILVSSLCAYTIARRTSRMSTALYLLCLIGIVIPFQLGLVPLYVAMHRLSLMPSYFGMILLNIGLWLPLAIFLYTGFIRAIPRDYEEAAQVDGAGLFRMYRRIVFPLLRPVTGTVAILTGVFTWNEFFVPLIFLSGSKYQTVPVALYLFVGENTSQWNIIFAGVVIALLPALLFYLFAQRQLIRGFTSGIRG
jgi:raffinose/stachyose/melibiose transport system permease protein